MQAAAQSDNDWEAPPGSGPVHATIRLPGSKSITNRALIIAALATGPTTIGRPLAARDTELMAAAIEALGATVTRAPGGDNGAGDNSDAWTVTPGWSGDPATVDVGNAGTVLRFVPPLAALAKADVRFHGDSRAAQRPVAQLLD